RASCPSRGCGTGPSSADAAAGRARRRRTGRCCITGPGRADRRRNAMITNRRALGDVLSEVTSGTFEVLAATPDLRIRRIAVVLPIEIRLHRIGGDLQILGDVPQAVTRTAFDLPPSRLELVCETGEPT